MIWFARGAFLPCSAAARLGAVIFIHRFGSALNADLHFHCCILDEAFGVARAAGAAATHPPPEIDSDARRTW
jgi:Putative transposase